MDNKDYRDFYANKFKSHEDSFIKIEPIEIREENGIKIEVYKPARAY